MSRAIIWTGIVALICLQQVSTFKLVCYFTNWSQYRDGSGRFITDDIDPGLCTHIIYAFASIKDNMIAATEWNDLSTYDNIHQLKTRNPTLKTLLSVGGYSAGSAPFRLITRSPATRSEFVMSVILFLRENNFDGLDLSWQYPERNDKRRLAYLVKELSIAFEKEAKDNPNMNKLILSVSVPAGKEFIDKGYDIKSISSSVDFLNFLTYDFHGYWEDNSHNYTGHISPLKKGTADSGTASSYNVDFAIKYLIRRGAQAEKIIMGIPAYGQTFTLSSSQTGVGAVASGPGNPGAFTKKAGMLAYYEICSFNHGARKVQIEEQAVPYSYKGNQWVGYEDVQSVALKVQYMKQNNLGGIMIWALDLDDFSGSFCNEGKYPLLGAAKKELDKRTTRSAE
ncbi:chitinase-3-like protein 1 [Anolis carolinensis]|uniref:Chitinase-3-like protein 1 n=1 Tax=Anolis carolinensis TaxID=28377 RepID=G1KBZ0_ANOCA|nr:PREDICTED: chitinase-3-like protein 1 [Anolis carolinensis]|eukprot:XP_003220422.1 PREDICTED: chitinase-3-like protein 1 [Anolis carolinensis]